MTSKNHNSIKVAKPTRKRIRQTNIFGNTKRKKPKDEQESKDQANTFQEIIKNVQETVQKPKKNLVGKKVKKERKTRQTTKPLDPKVAPKRRTKKSSTKSEKDTKRSEISTEVRRIWR